MKNCPTYLGYSVTEDGRVFTHRRRFGKGRGHGGGVIVEDGFCKELHSYKGHGGYPYFSVAVNGKQRSLPLHRLLADAFIGPCPSGMEVRHLDGCPEHNTKENITYGTVQENADDRVKNGKHLFGSTHGTARLNEYEVRRIRELHMDGETIAGIARLYGRGESTIRDIVYRRHWRHI